MKIEAGHIDKKEVAGKTGDGRNVVYVSTMGGLHTFFCKDEKGDIVSIGAAPHKAIAKFLALKKEPSIKWNEEFSKSESLEKSETTFSQLRKFMFSDLSLQKSEMSDTYLVYDVRKEEISAMKKNEIIEGLKNKTVDKYSIARDVNAVRKATCLLDMDEFSQFVGGE